jgi:hypothetical protein
MRYIIVCTRYVYESDVVMIVMHDPHGREPNETKTFL